MPGRVFNIGLIGYGFSAKIFHIPFIHHVPELNLYAIVQRTPKPDDDAEKDNAGVKVYRSVADMLVDEKVDAVVVTTAPDQHFELAKMALEAGKHGEPGDFQREKEDRSIQF
jgi:predicted dehydrogenase